MDEFVALWRDHIVPARAVHGFTVLGAWRDLDDTTFTWVVGHDAPDGWDAGREDLLRLARAGRPCRATPPTSWPGRRPW